MWLLFSALPLSSLATARRAVTVFALIAHLVVEEPGFPRHYDLDINDGQLLFDAVARALFPWAAGQGTEPATGSRGTRLESQRARKQACPCMTRQTTDPAVG
ncbi:hypothetical protein LX36DRAFT_191424 [Colletotrichum falcatum]|nr:hypothetical protein LX36DRAFT_191424 [Colletotrichum falcatum]